jgi:hypothetical protein
MPTQNLYNPEVVQLAGGLDYVTPRPVVAPGALIDCYNFEVADALGYKRITGVEPFDGRPSISNCYNSLYVLNVTSSTGANTNEALHLAGDTNSQAFAIITKVATGKITISVFDIAKFYVLYSGLATQVVSDSGSFTFTVTSVKSLYIDSASATISANIADIITNYNNAYARIQIASSQAAENSLVSYNPPIGLHWFKDQLYSVVDLHSFVFDTGTSQVYPNDILKNVGAGIDILVRDVQLISGSWAGANAIGKILFSLTTSDSYLPNLSTGLNTAIFGPVADNTALNIVRGSTTISSALKFRRTVAGTIPSTWLASLYRSAAISQATSNLYSSCGWQDIDMGYQFSFTNTNTTTFAAPIAPGRNSSPDAAVATTVSSLVTLPAGVVASSPGTLYFNIAPPTGADWAYNAGTNGQPQANIATQNDGLRIYNNSGAGAPPLVLNSFVFSNVPSDALITGIEIDGGAYVGATGAGAAAVVARTSVVIPGQTSAPVIKDSATITSTSSGATQSFSIGGSSENWGILNLTAANINTMVIYIAPAVTVAGTSHGDFSLDYLSVKVYYQTSSSIYYFYNGVDDVQAIITNSHVNTGTFAGATAVGTMQVAQVQPYSTAARSQINTNDVIRTLPAGAGAIVGKATSSMSFAGLPSLSQITASNSRYEMIDANFYGNKDWSAIYGVSGAGQAFVYDSFYFRYIYTGLSPTLDVPRHTAVHNFHLCLGYQVGALLTSVVGSPEDFAGVNGAAEFDTGDAITGLLRLNGTSLGIFCQDSIHSLNGTDNTNFSVSVLSPYEGAIEYTVANCGKPIYASYKGISTLEQTNAYGNFLGNRLSSKITPWVVARLTKSLPKLTIDSTTPSSLVFPNAGTQYPLFAQPIRAKNQYRLWFADGYFLIMTLMGAQADPVFTIGQINLTYGSADYLIPLAFSSDIDTTGLERNHVSYYNPLTGKATQAFGNSGVSTSTKNYVYELERGWGFAKCPIQGWFTATHNFFDNPFQIDRISKVRLHGQSLGAASLALAVSADYLSNDFTFGNLYGQTATNATPQDISLPRSGFTNSPATLSSDYQPFTNIANVAKSGRSFSMQFSTNPSTVEPPSVAQALLIQITENKGDV